MDVGQDIIQIHQSTKVIIYFEKWKKTFNTILTLITSVEDLINFAHNLSP